MYWEKDRLVRDILTKVHSDKWLRHLPLLNMASYHQSNVDTYSNFDLFHPHLYLWSEVFVLQAFMLRRLSAGSTTWPTRSMPTVIWVIWWLWKLTWKGQTTAVLLWPWRSISIAGHRVMTLPFGLWSLVEQKWGLLIRQIVQNPVILIIQDNVNLKCSRLNPLILKFTIIIVSKLVIWITYCKKRNILLLYIPCLLFCVVLSH